jgi:hypothetical protein
VACSLSLTSSPGKKQFPRLNDCSESHTTTCPLERRQDALEDEELHVQSRAHGQARFGMAFERHSGIATAQDRTD